MQYFTLLHLQKEPFSNSPDPEMFFQSTQHQGCLQKLELAIRLKRGLSVVIGDIGTGKSTLCRQLIQLITKGASPVLPYLILDPEFTAPLEFLCTIAKTFGLDGPTEWSSEWQLKDDIKKYLFEQAIQQQKVPVLILDEGQKLPGFCVEILREFLNFETNQYKILQIVIFAQPEFRAILKQKANFADRITTYQNLRPLSLRDTRAMIAFRLSTSHTEAGPVPKLFSRTAILAIYCLTRGYPRRIVMLCSKVIIQLLVKQKKQAGAWQVLLAARETASSRPGRWQQIMALTSLVMVAAAVMFFWGAERPLLSSPRPVPPATSVVAPTIVPRPEVTAPPPQEVGAVPVVREEAAPPSPPPPPSLSSTPAASPLPPAIMGEVGVEPGVILSKMVARVYGRYTPQRLALVLAANPNIITPDNIRAQTMISFPVLPQTELVGPNNQVWLELDEVATLAAAYRVVKEYPEASPPLLIKPTLTFDNLLSFHVILEESFANETAALARVKDLPTAWQGRARVKAPAGRGE